ncbi:hypothetical protein [Streptomyces sp. NPDC052015]|uniref:hypothetical protein n=1 Tax=unclassified Streptomyces TaxID=2593676 RepID=UPI003419B9E9
MDDISQGASDLTTPDRAARARTAWELYHGAYGGEVADLVTDLLHLADVDELPKGGADTVRRAAASYVAQLPLWPVKASKPAPVYLAQYRPKGGNWITVAEGDATTEVRDVANCLWYLLQKHGFRTGEIALHIDDIARGDVLTAEDGVEFRAIRNPELD